MLAPGPSGRLHHWLQRGQVPIYVLALIASAYKYVERGRPGPLIGVARGPVPRGPGLT